MEDEGFTIQYTQEGHRSMTYNVDSPILIQSNIRIIKYTGEKYTGENYINFFKISEVNDCIERLKDFLGNKFLKMCVYKKNDSSEWVSSIVITFEENRYLQKK